MNGFPLEIAIDGREYEQQYPTEQGMYYKTNEDCLSPFMKSYIHLYPTGRMTFLWNGQESYFANYDFESGEVKRL